MGIQFSTANSRPISQNHVRTYHCTAIQYFW